MKKLSTIIVDDDPGARDHLRELCKSRTELQLLAECTCFEHARNVILSSRPDLAFLAVQMQTGTGLQLARDLPASAVPMIVFVSGHDGHALEAFDLNAVDYVLKPVEQTRFCETIQRVMTRARAYDYNGRSPDRSSGNGHSPALSEAGTPARTSGPHRLIIEIGDRVHLVDVSDIESIEADRNYIWINSRDTYKVRASLKEIERLLPQERFFRVNRSVIVNSRCIASIERFAHGEYAIHLSSGGVVTTGRRFRGQIPGAILRRQA